MGTALSTNLLLHATFPGFPGRSAIPRTNRCRSEILSRTTSAIGALTTTMDDDLREPESSPC